MDLMSYNKCLFFAESKTNEGDVMAKVVVNLINKNNLKDETDRSSSSNHTRCGRLCLCYAAGVWRVEGLVGVSWREDGGGVDAGGGVEARDLGGTGERQLAAGRLGGGEEDYHRQGVGEE